MLNLGRNGKVAVRLVAPHSFASLRARAPCDGRRFDRAARGPAAARRGRGARLSARPDDRFIDAFEIEEGTAYLAFHRRNYEAQLLRLFRLGPDGGATLAFEDDLYGC